MERTIDVKTIVDARIKPIKRSLRKMCWKEANTKGEKDNG